MSNILLLASDVIKPFSPSDCADEVTSEAVVIPLQMLEVLFDIAFSSGDDDGARAMALWEPGSTEWQATELEIKLLNKGVAYTLFITVLFLPHLLLLRAHLV